MEYAATQFYDVSNHGVVLGSYRSVNLAFTPGGTAYFFFARIHGDALKSFSLFFSSSYFTYICNPLGYDRLEAFFAYMI